MPISASPTKPRLAITLGDPAGIGPEIIIKSLASPALRKTARYLIIGDCGVLENARQRLKINLNYKRITPADSIPDTNQIILLDLANIDSCGIKPGRLSRDCGRAAAEYILKAIELTKERRVDALVTAPISKEAVNLAGFNFAGHTEMLAKKTNSDARMMLVGGKLKVILVTTHLALKDVAKRLDKKYILDTLIIADKYGRRYFGLKKPRLGVCGLNPHSGEGGVLGREEIKIISPAVKLAQAKGIAAYGPYAADSLFYYALRGRFDIVIAMYHDQGLAPLKILAFDCGVNLTLGLPFVRTSPDHGTAFDIAGKAQASPRSMICAVKLAACILARRQV